jgi:hypothetical protein
MKITKDKDNLIVTIPLKQKIYNSYDEEFHGEMFAIVGVIAGDEQGFHHLIDMEYAGKPPQIGQVIISTCLEENAFRKLCDELGVECFTAPLCAYCNRPIWGCFTMGEKGNMCISCEYETEKKDKEKEKNIPEGILAGVSQWKNYGKKNGYWKYFEEEILKNK